MQIADQSSITNDTVLSRSSDKNYPSLQEETHEFLINDYPANQPIEILHDYFIWSIISSTLGFQLFGLVACFYSFKTRNSLRKNDLYLVRRFSRRTLIWNVAATLLAPASWAGVIYLAKLLHNFH